MIAWTRQFNVPGNIFEFIFIYLALEHCRNRTNSEFVCVHTLIAVYDLITARLSQLNLKLQLDSLATELKRLSLLQHDYLCIATSMLPSEISASASKTVSPISTVTKTATDTCILLDGYARRLCSARSKIAVVGNILESTQVFSINTY